VKVTVSLASHWPCVTDNSGITTYGLTALGREMSTPLYRYLRLWESMPARAVHCKSKPLAVCLGQLSRLSSAGTASKVNTNKVILMSVTECGDGANLGHIDEDRA